MIRVNLHFKIFLEIDRVLRMFSFVNNRFWVDEKIFPTCHMNQHKCFAGNLQNLINLGED